MKLKPLFDRLLVQYKKQNDQKTEAGLYLLPASQEKPNEAVVTSVGSTVLEVKVGDKVVLNRHSGTEVKVGNEEFVLVKEEDVLAIMIETVKKGK